MTEGYQVVPNEDRMFNLPEGNENCELCNGDGEVQCCAGEHYYYDDCNCVLIKYWEDKGNEFMADGYRKLLANSIRLRSM